MKFKRYALALCIVAAVGAAGGLGPPAHAGHTGASISGEVVNGYRILTVPDTREPVRLTVLRGDYVKFNLPAGLTSGVLSIPSLSIEKALDGRTENAPFFKMKKTGEFAFTLGDVRGVIRVLDYRQDHYREVDARQAAELIDRSAPLILDVRTPAEYDRGHLEGAVLIPVQILRGRLDTLSEYKDREILLYCASGNRSTVASKILVDNGFKHVINMRNGIREWYARKLPVVK